MWQLSTEQTAALVALQRRRDLRELGDVLAEAFPSVPQRVGARYGELIELGASRGQGHGLSHMLALARYLACWFMLGSEFETRPQHAWAISILGDARRDEGAKVFQLCRRCREELDTLSRTAPAQAPLSPDAFDKALVRVDVALARRGRLASLLARQRLRLGAACDIDAVDLRLHGAPPAQTYRSEGGQWRRAPLPGEREGVTLAAGVEASGRWPDELYALSPAGSAVKLRVRSRCAHVCDPLVHPQLVLGTVQGLQEWRGPSAADVLIELHADAPAPPPDAELLPVVALEAAPRISMLSLASCGLREKGQALGTAGRLDARLSVWPNEQHFIAWQRQPGAELAWPMADDAAPPLPSSRVRVERDGQALDAGRWQAALTSLDEQLHAGLARLCTAWERESGVVSGRLVAEPRILSGTAGITWGWVESPKGLREPPVLRVAGLFDLMACQLDLRLSGTLELHGSLSELRLHCAAATPLRTPFERLPADGSVAALLQRVQIKFSQPFVLSVRSLAHADLAVLDVVGAASGALVGSCGLRLRPDGLGLQWFIRLDVDAASVPLEVHDPLLGRQRQVRTLLPAMTLVDWSLG